MDCSFRKTRRHGVLLAAVVSIACAVAFAFPTLALAEGGTVKVTGSDATYGSLTEAAAAVKYAVLAVVIMLLSGTLVSLGHRLFPSLIEVAVKIPVDCLLFILSFYIQREIVYKKQ